MHMEGRKREDGNMMLKWVQLQSYTAKKNVNIVKSWVVTLEKVFKIIFLFGLQRLLNLKAEKVSF